MEIDAFGRYYCRILLIGFALTHCFGVETIALGEWFGAANRRDFPEIAVCLRLTFRVAAACASLTQYTHHRLTVLICVRVYW